MSQAEPSSQAQSSIRAKPINIDQAKWSSPEAKAIRLVRQPSKSISQANSIQLAQPSIQGKLWAASLISYQNNDRKAMPF